MTDQRFGTWIFTCSVALVASGCSLIVAPADRPERCDPSVENVCGTGWSCNEVAGVHRCLEVECVTNDDCEPGFRCFDQVCLEAECVDSERCEIGYYCREGFCVPGCDGPTRCPPGRVCVDETCREPQIEICNNIDDDFDGEVDEGFDADEDGWSSCENVSQPPDCNDGSPYARPGLEEICDGLDNDCDGPVDEDTCPFGQTCVPGMGCIDVGTCLEDEDCREAGEGLLCAPDGRCVEPAEFGEACTFDDQCLAGTCQFTGALGVSGQRCTEQCCSTHDCEALSSGAFCADNGSGLRFCAAPGWFSSDTIECAGQDCQVCALRPGDGGYRCVNEDLCCGNNHHEPGRCSRGCQIIEGRTPAAGVSDVVLMICDVRTGRRLFEGISATEASLGLAQCNSGLSWRVEHDGIWGWSYQCSAPCCDNSDCVEDGTLGQCVLTSDLGFPACYDAATVPSSIVSLGSERYGNGSCGGLDDWDRCESGVCHPEGYCTEACCPGGACLEDDIGRSYQCQPQLVGGVRWINLCTRTAS